MFRINEKKLLYDEQCPGILVTLMSKLRSSILVGEMEHLGGAFCGETNGIL